ncbi:MAG: hypothetical protein ACFFBD_14555, partial [Candidatus Hodarchaeota archaeon]
QHFHRAANEYVAFRLAHQLGVQVPESFIITSKNIGEFPLDKTKPLDLGENVIIFDEAAPIETIGEFYNFKNRLDQNPRYSDRFDSFLMKQVDEGGYEVQQVEDVIAVLSQFIPGTTNLDAFLDERREIYQEKIKELRSLKNARKLIPFDVWLSGPDRNAGNYLVDNSNPRQVFGIDYEMWSFAETDIIEEDDITKGRSYLTAVLHPATSMQDPIIKKSLEKIMCLSEQDIKQICQLPCCYVKFVEYMIAKGIIKPDEREKLILLEENLKDFLWETRNRLREKLAHQIGEESVKSQ